MWRLVALGGLSPLSERHNAYISKDRVGRVFRRVRRVPAACPRAGAGASGDARDGHLRSDVAGRQIRCALVPLCSQLVKWEHSFFDLWHPKLVERIFHQRNGHNTVANGDAHVERDREDTDTRLVRRRDHFYQCNERSGYTGAQG